MVLVGENNVGKSNILEALKAFNDTDIKLCNENDYFKAHESEYAVLSLEEETILDHKTIGFSCVDLRIRSQRDQFNLKELSKILISYPFSVFVGGFINLIMSYGVLDSFLKSYKEKLKLSAFSTRQANNLLFKELIKHVSGNSEWIKNFCQCIKEIIKCNTPDKKYNTDEFFVMGQHKQNQLAKIYSYFKKLSEGEIKPQNEDILKKLKGLDEIFKTTDFDEKFAPKIEVLQNKQSQERPSELIKDIIKEIDEKYLINENFKQQFRTFRLNIGNLKKKIKNSLKYLEKTREDFERKKESWIKEIENDCKNQKTLEFDYDVLLDNIQQICEKYIASHVVSDESKDMKSMMCQFYLKKIDLLVNSEIEQYRYNDFLESARKFLWEDIKTLDEKSGVHLFPKNIDEIKDKFEINKKKLKQSKNVSEFAEYCRECNPYTAFQGLRNRVNFPLKDYSLDEFVPNMRECKDLKITDSDLKIKPLEDFHSQFFAHCFFQSLFNKIDFNPTIIWHSLETKRTLQIKFDKNNDLEVYFGFDKSFVIPKKYLQEIDQELLKEIRRSDYPFPKCEYHNDKDMVQLTFSKDDASPLMVEVSLAEILEYNMQLKIDSSIAKEFNKLLAIAEDSPQDSYQLKIRVRHNNKFYDYSNKSTAYE
ncbi:AAA family ATPase [Helicobacter pylori]|uniref:AAA family ATPase n=1 Tax=Helicobacter pylori TaxID=210 RepID=UPI003F68E0EA